MAEQRARGIEHREEVDPVSVRQDVRTLSRRAGDYFKTTEGVLMAMIGLPIIVLLLSFVPLTAEIALLVLWHFWRKYVRDERFLPVAQRRRSYDFPARVPASSRQIDGSQVTRRLGNGITYLGKEMTTNLEIWLGDTDLRTHMMFLGTTGSGKTELLLGLVYNALVQNSGVLYCDGKGDVQLFLNIFRIARYLGREDDLLVINFLTSGRDQLGKHPDIVTNRLNSFANGSSGQLIELIIGLLDDASGGGGDMWKGRAIAFIGGLTRALTFLRDRGYFLLDSEKFQEFLELPVVERLVWKRQITVDGQDISLDGVDKDIWAKVIKPLEIFVLTLPGYDRSKQGQQEQKTVEQFGFITMQLTRAFGDLSFTYGHIFSTAVSEVDMYDVVLNRRILVVLLPALERAPDSLKMIGKLIVGSIKQMMAGCLGNRIEGSIREIVESRPTTAKVPFYVILDEYGYYAVLGFAVAPAQARSLGFPQPVTARVFVEEGGRARAISMGEMRAGHKVVLPAGGSAEVVEVQEHGLLPCSVLQLDAGVEVEAANVHHWPVRIDYQRMRVLTTFEIASFIREGKTVELSIASSDALTWHMVTRLQPAGDKPCRCLIVAHPTHCYLTDHRIVTHNCIVFAAQDFSSLQKSSKEEADATWENTGFRGIGRSTSGQESDTWKRISGLAGKAQVYEPGTRERKVGQFLDRFTASDNVQLVERDRVSFDDVAKLADGEFIFLFGKKQNKGSRGGIRVIRGLSFYTGVEKSAMPLCMRGNHFLHVRPGAQSLSSDDGLVVDEIERVLYGLLASGEVGRRFENRPMPVSGIGIYRYACLMREARARAQLSGHDAVRVALVALEKEVAVAQSQAVQQIPQAISRPAAADLAPLTPGGGPQNLRAARRQRVDGAPGSVAGQPAVSPQQNVVARTPPIGAVTPPVRAAEEAESAEIQSRPMQEAIRPAVGEAMPHGEKDDKSGERTTGAGQKTGSGGSGGAGMHLDIPRHLPGHEPEASGSEALSRQPAATLPVADSAASGGIGARLSRFIADSDDEDDEAPIIKRAAPLPAPTFVTTFPREAADGSSSVPQLERAIQDTDIILGHSPDVMKVAHHAQEAASALVQSTRYVESGQVPEPITPETFDDLLAEVTLASMVKTRSMD